MTAFASSTSAGAALAEALARGERLSVRRPSERVERPVAGRPLLLDEPGFHELRTGTTTHLWIPVSVSAEESDLTAMSRQSFVEGIARPADSMDTVSMAMLPPADTNWGWMLAWFAAALLLLEGLMAGRMARRREAEIA